MRFNHQSHQHVTPDAAADAEASGVPEHLGQIFTSSSSLELFLFL